MAKRTAFVFFACLTFAVLTQCQLDGTVVDAPVGGDDGVEDPDPSCMAQWDDDTVLGTLETFGWARRKKATQPPAVVNATAPNATAPVAAAAASGVSSTIVVDASGSGDYETIQEAIDAAPAGTATARTKIIIKKGTYKEKVVIPSTKPFLTILAEAGATVIYNKAAKNYKFSPSLAATFSVLATDVIIQGLRCVNNYGWPNGRKGSQAPALWVMADRVAFYDCTFEGHQDTLFAHIGRQYYKNCAITGSVDYIFGNARALFEDCTYTCINNQDNHFSSVSAHYRQSLSDNVGFVFLRGTIKANLGFKGKLPLLGRIWGPYNTAVFAYVNIATKIGPGGWGPMKMTPKSYFKTALVYEYKNTGKGAKVPQRVKWAHTDLTSEEQALYLGQQWIDGSEWVVAP